MGWSDVFDFLAYFGVTKETIVVIVILSFIGYVYLNHKFKIFQSFTKAIVEIQTLLSGMRKNIKYPLTETSGSPLHPTEYGTEIYVESGFKNIIEQNKDSFLKDLEKELSKLKMITAYDVQEKAIAYCTAMKDNILVKDVKNYAFKNGLDVVMILRIGGFVLRDYYLAKHKV